MTEEVELVLRQADVEDAPALVDFFAQIEEESEYVMLSHLSVEQQAILIERYHTRERDLLMVATLDDEVIGVGNVACHSQEEMSHSAEVGVCVRKAFWNNGIGTELMWEIMQFAKEIGIESLTLEVVDENELAIRLYRKYGFEKVGQFRRRLRKGNRYLNTLLMEYMVQS